MTHEEIRDGVRANLTGCVRPQAVTKAMVERGARALGGYTPENGYLDEDWQAAGDASELRERAARVLHAALGSPKDAA